MTNNPYINALATSGYIGLIALFIFNAGAMFDSVNASIVMVGMLLLFVTSAAITGYLVLYQPLVMLTLGKQKEAVTFFFKTIFTLVAITVVVFLILALAF